MALPRGRRRKDYLLNPQEAADIVGCHRNTVYNWIKRNEIQYSRDPKNKKYIRIRKSHLKQFVLDNYGIHLE
jgi:excisionase family DNA binding protein